MSAACALAHPSPDADALGSAQSHADGQRTLPLTATGAPSALPAFDRHHSRISFRGPLGLLVVRTRATTSAGSAAACARNGGRGPHSSACRIASSADRSRGSFTSTSRNREGHRIDPRVGLADRSRSGPARSPPRPRSGVVTPARQPVARFMQRPPGSALDVGLEGRLTAGVRGGATRRIGIGARHPRTPPMGRSRARSAATQ